MRRRVALVRGPFLNAFECQSYAPLLDRYAITGFASVRHLHPLSKLPIPVIQLPAGPSWSPRFRWLKAFVADHAAQAVLGEGRYLPGLVPQLARFDVVHTVETAHGFSGQAVMAKRRFGCRVVVTVWENLPFNRKGYSRYAFDRVRPCVLAEADAFLAVTEHAKETLSLEGVPPGRIWVIPMGVDLARFRPAPPDMDLRRRLGLAIGSAVILSVGTMSASKGLAVLLHAIKRACLDQDLRQAPFSVILVGRDVGGAEGMIAQLGLERIVQILGYVSYDDVPALYNLADILVHPSVPTPTWQEQFGMVLIESLASGTPVLTTTSGSIPEIVGDAGVLVPSADHVALYRALKELLLDSASREKLGRLGRQRVEALFDCQVVAQKIDDLYGSLF